MVMCKYVGDFLYRRSRSWGGRTSGASEFIAPRQAQIRAIELVERLNNGVHHQ